MAEDDEIYYGFRLGALFSAEYAPYTDDGVAIESTFETLNNNHTGFFYGYVFLAIIIASIVHLTRKIWVRKRELRVRFQGFANFTRWLRRFFLSRGYVAKLMGLPTGAHALVVTLFVVMNFWVCAWSSRPNLQLIQLARRTGWFSVTNGTLLIFLAMKNTPLAWLTGLSYEKLNVFHRWVAVIALVEGAVHTIAVAVGLSRLIPSRVGMLLTPDNVWGMIALALWMVILASFYLLKTIRYEVFYIMHLVLFPATLIACFLHNPRFARRPIGVAFGIYIIDRAIRYNRMYWHNRYANILKAEVQSTDDERMLVVVKVPRGNLMWRPGTHAFLCIPGIRYIESYPFSIASVGDDIDTVGGKKTIEFVIQPKDGFTKAVKELAETRYMSDGVSELRAIIDGPYGAMPNFNNYDNLLLYASGSGITFILPIALSCARKARVRYIEFIWATKKVAFYEKIRPQLEELARYGSDGPITPHVVIRLHETAPLEKKKGGRRMLQRVKTMVGMEETAGRGKLGFRGRRTAESTTDPYGETTMLISGQSEDATSDGPPPLRSGHTRFSSGDTMPSDTGLYSTSPVQSPPAATDLDEKRRGGDLGSPGDSLTSDDDDDDYDESEVFGGARRGVHNTLGKVVYKGRPEIPEIVREFIGKCRPDQTCVIASCGPGSNNVREEATKLIKKGGPSTSLIVEEFGW